MQVPTITEQPPLFFLVSGRTAHHGQATAFFFFKYYTTLGVGGKCIEHTRQPASRVVPRLSAGAAAGGRRGRCAAASGRAPRVGCPPRPSARGPAAGRQTDKTHCQAKESSQRALKSGAVVSCREVHLFTRVIDCTTVRLQSAARISY